MTSENKKCTNNLIIAIEFFIFRDITDICLKLLMLIKQNCAKDFRYFYYGKNDL